MALVLVSQEQRKRLSAEQFNQIQRNYWLLNTPAGRSGGDCVVTYEGQNARLYRDIICERSSFFRLQLPPTVFKESSLHQVSLEGFVSAPYLRMIIQFIYLSIPEAGYALDMYGPMSDAVFYKHMFELYRQACYLMVPSLTQAIIAELKKRLEQAASIVFQNQYTADPRFKTVFRNTMEVVVHAYDNSNEHHEVYNPLRAYLFRWVELCYPVLSREGDDFYEYLGHAPMLAVTILKTNHNIRNSNFILPGPGVRCGFCDVRLGSDYASKDVIGKSKFGLFADARGGVRYICSGSGCLRQLSVSMFRGGRP
ncbi:hypothetical protein KVR01_011332 [Diaporthe batatas]|uniref:uncharacterized protein n=1 Tax=Diaporthe batatas TaxID=748121 RepID=UPI001D0458FC|nr:uncharacterized protein KVR01_011332 [Diaporthe batatas]KAG8158889.1 hypothetical protein KVR01_011332 [Diaporthe batatas]